jgi:hypothetical protein
VKEPWEFEWRGILMEVEFDSVCNDIKYFVDLFSLKAEVDFAEFESVFFNLRDAWELQRGGSKCLSCVLLELSSLSMA